MPVAADQLEAVAGNDRDEAVPVVFDLVQPAVAVRRLGAGRNDLERNATRYLGRHRLRGQGEARHGEIIRWRTSGRLPRLDMSQKAQ